MPTLYSSIDLYNKAILPTEQISKSIVLIISTDITKTAQISSKDYLLRFKVDITRR